MRWVKSSQGIRRGTYGWITSFYFISQKKNEKHFLIVNKGFNNLFTKIKCLKIAKFSLYFFIVEWNKTHEKRFHAFGREVFYFIFIQKSNWARSPTVHQEKILVRKRALPLQGRDFGFESRRVHFRRSKIWNMFLNS